MHGDTAMPNDKAKTVDSTMAPHDPKRIISELLNSPAALVATTDEGRIIVFAGSDTPDVSALYNWWSGVGYVGRGPAPAK
jgi:hypothetical protein